MADETRPFIGYRSAGRRPESQQDRRAAADAPLSALRGMVSGVLGAPGDIESLIRMLPGLSERTVLPTSEDVEKRLPMPELNQTPTGRAFTTAGQLAGGFYNGPGSPLRAIAALPSTISRAARDFAISGSPVHVIKPKGGNWLEGSIEQAVHPLKQSYPEIVAPGIGLTEDVVRARHPQISAVNQWLEKKLSKYIRSEMATPEDPLRALAERGVLHIDPAELNFRPEMHGRYLEPGQTAVAQSPAAKSWEGASDLKIGQEIKPNPYKPGEQFTEYSVSEPRNTASDLGFSHLADELRNAINPEGGLPAHLQWKYGDLSKVTVPQAVQRVADINEWRAAQKAEADLVRARNPATFTHKEYPEQGMSWVELRQPKELPEGWKKPEGGKGMYIDPEGNPVFTNPREASLADALKYEGETMGHCVGGYCPDVVEGRSKIYSLRDKKGQPHVTIEVKPAGGEVDDFIEQASSDLGYGGMRMEDIAEEYGHRKADAIENKIIARAEKLAKESRKSGMPSIIQIKGKANRAPNAEYLPAVQDFVRSGNWGRVGDLQNTGLIDARAAGKPLPGRPAFMTEDEFKAYESEIKGEGFASGGLVEYNPAKIQSLVDSLREEMYG